MYWRDYSIKQYTINKEEEKEFKTFLQDFITLDYNNFAINKYHIALYMPYEIFKITNYVECLEHLLVPDSQRKGSKPKATNRTADDRWEPLKRTSKNNSYWRGIKQELKSRGAALFDVLNLKSYEGMQNVFQDFYEFRSAIVHGDRNYQKLYLDDKGMHWKNGLIC